MAESQIPQKPLISSDALNDRVVLPVIKTMPEKYIGAASGKPPIVREVVETKTVAAKSPAPKPPSSPARPPQKKSGKRRNIIIISIVVVISGLGAAAYILLMPAPTPIKPPPVNQNTNNNTNNQPPIINNPPSPICGNGLVENGEQCDAGAQNGASGSTCSAACQTVEVKPPLPPNTGVDSDSDGLTDVEEKTVYGTNPLNADTDGDTFNDGNEVAHLYDPIKRTPALLKDSSAMKMVVNKTEGYTALVPETWTTSRDDTAQVMINAPSGEFFEILVTDKPKDQSLVEWYLAMSPGANQNDVERFKTLQGYDALRSPDRLTTYIDPGNGELYTLAYNFGDKTTLEFRTTYEMFIQSFSLGSTGPSKP